MPQGPVPAAIRPGAPLVGGLRAPGDGPVSQLALVLGLLAVGVTTIEGLAEDEDTLRMVRACAALGARVARLEAGVWRVAGVGVGGLVAPAAPLDAGGSEIAAALLLGVVGAHPVSAALDGDAGLRGRTVAALAEPLARMGAAVAASAQGHGRDAPGRPTRTVTGAREAIPIAHAIDAGEDPAASATIASALLVAGLNSPGRVTVIAPAAEGGGLLDDAVRLLRLFGASILAEPHGAGARAVSVEGQPELRGAHVCLPADPFLAACALVAALIAPGSDVRVDGVATDRVGAGLLPILRDMGATVAVEAQRVEAGAPVADLRVRASRLAGVAVPPERAASLGDALPLLAVAAACAAGETRIGLPARGLPPGLCDGLAVAGVDHAVEGDDLVVRGAGVPPPGGARIAPGTDPRAAAALALLGLGARGGARLDDLRPIAAIFPTFASLLRGLGADIEETARWAS